MILIVLSGLASSGKDTVANIFSEIGNLQKVAFADDAKRMLINLFGFTEEVLWGPSELRNVPNEKLLKKGIHLTARKALQTLCTDFVRKCYPDKWADDLFDMLDRIEKEPNEWFYDRTKGFVKTDFDNYSSGIVISDLRFHNEYILSKQRKAILIKINKENAGLKGEEGKHISETDMNDIPDDSYNYIINNNRSLDELKINIKLIWEDICLKK